MATLYLDGRLMDESRARIPATDPALSWGVGFFEVVRAYSKRPFLLERHVQRLEASARHFGYDVELPELAEVIEELFEVNGIDGGYVRITWTGGGHLIVVVQEHQGHPPRVYRKGGALEIAGFRRDPAAPLAGHKTLNYLENMQTRWDAEGQGVIDALVLGMRGEVLEGTRCNVFARLGDQFVTPTVHQGILPGVTRGLVLELAADQGIPVRERRLRLKELFAADELFITSTMMEIAPIVRVAEHTLPGPGEWTRALRRAYARRVKKDCKTR